MFSPILLFFLLIPLFYFLSRVADLVVSKIKSLSILLGMNIATIGVLLGLFTTLPELSIGFNSVVIGEPEIAFGNLMGGIIVLFCLVLGISLVLNRSISTDGRAFSYIPTALYLLSPLLLSLDGELGFFDGILLVLFYILLLRYKFMGDVSYPEKFKTIRVEFSKIWKEVIWIISGAILVVITSNVIVRVAMEIISEINIGTFVMGLVVFAVGTNLPELMVSIRSWKQNAGDLSLSHIFGSVLANNFILGFIVMTKSVKVEKDTSFYFLLTSLAIVIFSFLIFYKSDRALTRKEGYALLAYYAVFLIGQALFS